MSTGIHASVAPIGTTTDRRGPVAGVALSALVGTVLSAAAAGKLAGTEKITQGFAELGIPAAQIPKIGVVLSMCLALYANPRTAVLGALGLTAYLGGAVAVNLRAQAPLFGATLTAVYVGILMWIAMILRRPELLKVLGLNR